MKKKLMNWIQNGFSSFNHIVKDNIKRNQNNINFVNDANSNNSNNANTNNNN